MKLKPLLIASVLALSLPAAADYIVSSPETVVMPTKVVKDNRLKFTGGRWGVRFVHALSSNSLKMDDATFSTELQKEFPALTAEEATKLKDFIKDRPGKGSFLGLAYEHDSLAGQNGLLTLNAQLNFPFSTKKLLISDPLGANKIELQARNSAELLIGASYGHMISESAYVYGGLDLSLIGYNFKMTLTTTGSGTNAVTTTDKSSNTIGRFGAAPKIGLRYISGTNNIWSLQCSYDIQLSKSVPDDFALADNLYKKLNKTKIEVGYSRKLSV